jgi:hypothetical protein
VPFRADRREFCPRESLHTAPQATQDKCHGFYEASERRATRARIADSHADAEECFEKRVYARHMFCQSRMHLGLRRRMARRSCS